MPKIAKYERIKQEINQQINDNIIKPNQVILSENEMCQKYGVSRVTIRKAIDDLCREGVLYRIKGKGCFVREGMDQKRSKIYSFTEAVKNEGKVPSKKQLSLTIEQAGKELASRLEIDEKDEVYIIKSIYFADDIPYSINTSILPVKLFKNLEYFDFNNRSLYEVLKAFYNTEMYHVRQTIEAVSSDEEISQLLNVDEKEPLLKIKAVSYCLKENHEIPVEYYEACFLTEIQSYYVEKFSI